MEATNRFKRIEHAGNNADLASLYGEILESGLGDKVPLNWFTSQAERPDLLAMTWRLTQGVLLQGQLPPTIKHMILVKVSNHNQCRYCSSMHMNALEAMGVPKEVIDSLTSDLDLAQVPPPQRAILEFAMKAAREPKAVNDEDFEELHELGLSQGETMEVAMMGAYANFVNTWADVCGIPVESERNS